MNASFEPKKHEQSRSASRKDSLSAISYPSRTFVHAKLEVTNPGDHDEREADAVADEVVNGGKIARKISSNGGSSGIAVPSQMESRLSQSRGGGQPMPHGLQSMMEGAFGQGFPNVRIHTDAEAASMSSSIHAKAFTHGNDIYFNQGQFSPATTDGQRLIAHELTHTVQSGNRVSRQSIDEDNQDDETNELIEPSDFELRVVESAKARSLDNKDEMAAYKNAVLTGDINVSLLDKKSRVALSYMGTSDAAKAIEFIRKGVSPDAASRNNLNEAIRLVLHVYYNELVYTSLSLNAERTALSVLQSIQQVTQNVSHSFDSVFSQEDVIDRNVEGNSVTENLEENTDIEIRSLDEQIKRNSELQQKYKEYLGITDYFTHFISKSAKDRKAFCELVRKSPIWFSPNPYYSHHKEINTNVFGPGAEHAAQSTIGKQKDGSYIGYTKCNDFVGDVLFMSIKSMIIDNNIDLDPQAMDRITLTMMRQIGYSQSKKDKYYGVGGLYKNFNKKTNLFKEVTDNTNMSSIGPGLIVVFTGVYDHIELVADVIPEDEIIRNDKGIITNFSVDCFGAHGDGAYKTRKPFKWDSQSRRYLDSLKRKTYFFKVNFDELQNLISSEVDNYQKQIVDEQASKTPSPN